MMTTDTRGGPYPYAGVPWFSTAVRPRRHHDGAGLPLVAIRALARGVLSYLAATQATEVESRARRRAGQDPARDARRRDGRAGRSPVRPLLRQRRRHAAFRHAGRRLSTSAPATWPSIRAIWPHLEAALRWIDDYGDHDGDGFVEYARQSSTRAGAPGLEGFARRRLPRRRPPAGGADRPVRSAGLRLRGPARRRPAGRRLGEAQQASRAATPGARSCGQRFERAFWCDDLATYALALDGAEASLPGAQLQRGPVPVHRHRRAGAGRAAWPRRC